MKDVHQCEISFKSIHIFLISIRHYKPLQRKPKELPDCPGQNEGQDLRLKLVVCRYVTPFVFMSPVVFAGECIKLSYHR